MKEYKILDTAIQGIRKYESVKRLKLYKEPIVCRIYGSKKNHVNVFLPILDWTDADVEQFISYYGVKCHPLYYNDDGKFCVKRRLGCIGCPLASDNGVSGFKKYPKFVKQWIENGSVWWDKPRVKDISSKQKFSNIYELFAHNLFYPTFKDFLTAKSATMFGSNDFKSFLEDYFNVSL